VTALALCVPVQAHTPENDALRVRAEEGNAEAQYDLGVMYDNGEGVPQDDVQAHMWTNLAASRLTGELRDRSVKNRDIIAAKMAAEQIAEAQRLAREWDDLLLLDVCQLVRHPVLRVQRILASHRPIFALGSMLSPLC
jgi:hypothetical protein